MSDVNSVIAKRLLRVSKRIEEIATGKTAAAAKPAAAKKPAVASTKRVALDNPGKGTPALDKVAPVLNNVDTKTKALDKMINGFLAALDRKNETNAKTLLKSIVTKLTELGDMAKKLPTTASAANTKKSAERTLRRANALVARHGKQYGVVASKPAPAKTPLPRK